MIDKEELIKIYSAYLPYQLNIDTSHWDDENSPLGKNIVAGIRGDDLICQYGWASTHGRMIEQEYSMYNAKPILYDLSYLTKEELRKAGFDNHVDYLTNEREGLITRRGFDDYINRLPYGHFSYLIRNHYNVFNLSADQFINKATLNKL